MRKTLTIILITSLGSTSWAQNTFPSSGNVGIGTTSPTAKLHLQSTYSGGSGDYTNIINAQLKIHGGSSYWRIAYVSPNSSISGVYNFESNKDVYWGEASDGGRYRFRGRDLIVENNSIGISTLSPIAPLHIKSIGGGSHLVIETDAAGQGDLRWYQGGIDGSNSRAAFQVDENNGDFEGWVYGTTWNQWLQVDRLTQNVGIGTTTPDARLTVKGDIHAEEVTVDLSVPGPDYVFETDYDLPTLEETETYIKANKRLPEIPSAKEMEEEGINLAEMNMLLLKKVEELTLHVIELNRRSKLQQSEIEILRNYIDR